MADRGSSSNYQLTDSGVSGLRPCSDALIIRQSSKIPQFGDNGSVMMRVEICELRPKVTKMYWFTTEVEPMCDEGYLLRHLLRKIEGQESPYNGSEDL